MQEWNLENILADFENATAEDWKALIDKQLKGENYNTLISSIDDNIIIEPFYTYENSLQYQLNIPQKENTDWLITEKIIVDENNIALANQDALDSLNNGINSIVFDLRHKDFSAEQIKILSKDIIINIAPIYFLNSNIDNKKSIIQAKQTHKFTTYLLADLLMQSTTTKSNVVLFPIPQHYLLAIASLNAFRWLWSKLHQNSTPIIIAQTVLPTVINDENKYLLYNTTQAMSAIIGQCNHLIVTPHQDNNFGKRMAKNTQLLLLHESNFNEIKNINKGNYLIAHLTYQICEKVWKMVAE
ncbi:MAG: hypothetical protein H6553_12865 [Chitinophagales bacterium]|nr:hypothetical protein [Chitinophagales bacterium]